MLTEGVMIMTNVMMERGMMGMPGMNPMMGSASMTGATGAMTPNVIMVPRCTIKVEKMTGGMKIMCSCSDAAACAMMQNLCQMLAGSMCTACCMMNGMMVCSCSLTMGICACEMTKDGCMVT